MTFPRFNYPILTYRVIDGDTVEAVCDLGWDATKKVAIRLQGINAPETNRKTERAAGKLVELMVRYWLGLFPSRDLTAVSYKKDMYYGCVVGDILYTGDEEEWDGSLTEFLLRFNVVDKLTKTGRRKPMTAKRLKQIENLATAGLQLIVGPALRVIDGNSDEDGTLLLENLGVPDWAEVDEVNDLLTNLDLVKFFNHGAQTAEWWDGFAKLTEKGREWLKKAPR